MVGEFEYLVLTAIARLGDEAYGVAIRRLLGEFGRAPSIGALYTTLDRLEGKGFVSSRMAGPTPERGGRAKRMVRLTPQGVLAGKAFFRTVTLVSRGVAWAE